MPKNKISLGQATLTTSSVGKVSVSMPKSGLEVLKFFAGIDVEMTGYFDPPEIVIRPKNTGDSTVDGMIEESLKRQPWGLINENTD